MSEESYGDARHTPPSAPTDADRFHRATESLHPARALGWEPGKGRPLSEYVTDTGISEAELLSAKRIVDLGSGPVALPWTKLADTAKKKGMTPPKVFAVSAAYKDPSALSRLMNELTKTGTEDFIEPIAEYADRVTIQSTADYVLAEHLFEHLVPQDIPPTIVRMLDMLAPGGRAVIVPIVASKTASEVGFSEGTLMSPPAAGHREKDFGIQHGIITKRAVEILCGKNPQLYSVRIENTPVSPEMQGKWFKSERIVIEKRIENT